MGYNPSVRTVYDCYFGRISVYFRQTSPRGYCYYWTPIFSGSSVDTVNILTPDEFEGSDTEKLQAAFDYFGNNGGVLCINRPYNLEADIVINHSAINYPNITVLGLGVNSKIYTAGHEFIGGTSQQNGGIDFINVFFTGAVYRDGTATNRNGDIVSGISAETTFFRPSTNLIRMSFTDCVFEWSNYIIDVTSPDTYAQTWYFVNCYQKLIKSAAARIALGFDVKFIGCKFEPGDNAGYFIYSTVVANGVVRGLCVEDCLIEGCATGAIVGSGFRGCKISGNYFESNGGVGINFISGDTIGNEGIEISGNYSDDTALVVVPTSPTSGRMGLDIHGNSVENRATQYILKTDNDNATAYKYSDLTIYANSGLIGSYNNAYKGDTLQKLINGASAASDWNTVGTGIYTAGGTAVTNGPVASPYGVLIAFESLDNYLVQIFFGAYPQNAYYRTRAGVTASFSAWKQII